MQYLCSCNTIQVYLITTNFGTWHESPLMRQISKLKVSELICSPNQYQPLQWHNILQGVTDHFNHCLLKNIICTHPPLKKLFFRRLCIPVSLPLLFDCNVSMHKCLNNIWFKGWQSTHKKYNSSHPDTGKIETKWFRSRQATCLSPSHYRNRCWHVSWTPKNELQWYSCQNTRPFHSSIISNSCLQNFRSFIRASLC